LYTDEATIIKKQYTETLKSLGLNGTEARVYLSLLFLGQSKAKTIWKTSKINRQDIYRTLNELGRKGLIEKIVTSPATFRALPLQDGLTTLLKERAKEYETLKKKAKELNVNFPVKPNQTNEKNECEYVIVSSKNTLMHKLEDAGILTKDNINIIDSFDNLKRRMMKDSEIVTLLFQKKVKLRCIINKPREGQNLAGILGQERNQNGQVEVRLIPEEPLTTLRIDDKKRVLVRVSAQASEESHLLYSDSPCLVAVFQDYFERLWSEATEDKKIYHTSKRSHTYST
jgi:sugar-specific transcriptional regulator TrmB